MKKIITNFAIMLMLIGASTSGLFAQTFCLQMTEVSNDGTNLVISVGVQGDVAFTIGSSNLQFSATDGAFGSPVLLSSPLVPPFYFVPTVTEPSLGTYSLNIELAFSDAIGDIVAAPGFSEVAQISLPILDAGLANNGIAWQYNGGTTETVVFLDDEATQLFATSAPCLVGYNGSPAIINGCMDMTAANYDPAATNDDGSCLYDVTFNVDMNCESGFIEPALEGPLFGWCGGCVPLADPDMDGIWSTTVQIPAGPFEYKYAVDAFASQENLVDDMVNGGTCAPITDFSSFANRQVIVVAGLVLNDTYGTCGICDPTVGCTDPLATNFSPTAVTPDGSCLYDVTFNVDLNCYDGNDSLIDVNTPGGFTTIAIEGPSLGWCGSCVTLADNGSGIWSVTLTLPSGPFEYKYAHDVFAGQEQLVDDMVNGGTCAPITDFNSFANREIIIPTTLITNDTYGSCDACGPDCPTDLNGDGATDGEDFSVFLGNFGLACAPPTPCPTDFDFNGTTNGEDFSFFLGNFGLVCN